MGLCLSFRLVCGGVHICSPLSHSVLVIKWGYAYPVAFTASWKQWKDFLTQKTRRGCEPQHLRPAPQPTFQPVKLPPNASHHATAPWGVAPHLPSFDFHCYLSVTPTSVCSHAAPSAAFQFHCSVPTSHMGGWHPDHLFSLHT